MRLAREQGLLSGDLNPFQRFALVYWLYMDRRQVLDDRRSELEQMTFNLDESRWSQIYLPSLPPDLGQGIPVGFGDGSGMDDAPVDDVGDLDSYFENLERPRTVSAADVIADDGRWV